MDVEAALAHADGIAMWGTVTATFHIVTESVAWEQGYGLLGRHEVMGVAG